MLADLAVALPQQRREMLDVRAQIRFGEGPALDEAHHEEATLGVDDFGREAGGMRGHGGRSLAITEDVMDWNVVAATHDELLAGILDDKGQVGQPAGQRRHGHRTAPTRQRRDPPFEVSHGLFASRRGLPTVIHSIISRRPAARYPRALSRRK